MSFPAIQFITSFPGFVDYRPAVDASGTQVVFERNPYPANGNPTTLHLVSNIGGPCHTGPVPNFLPASSAATFPIDQTRPDWNWATGKVAFSGVPSGYTRSFVYIVGSNGINPSQVPNTLGYLYPTWSTDGTMLVVDVNDPANTPPFAHSNALINLNGAPSVLNLNGNDARGHAVFGGFAAPQPGNPHYIAFAGQSQNGQAYSQDTNYVFLNQPSSANVTGNICAPLEPNAIVATYDASHQGRAPSWSPNGQYIVFESNRNGDYALFLANVAQVRAGATPVQLTGPGWGAQHAKFLPNGTHLVFSAFLTPGSSEPSPRGIAMIDITAYLT
jgi:Tol biopolymer transport system component